MPKRSNEDESDYLRRKLKKIQKKLEKCEQVFTYNSDESTNISPIAMDPYPEHKDETEQSIDAELIPMNIIDETQPSTSIVNAETAVINSPTTEITTEMEPINIMDSNTLDDEILNLLGDTPSKDKKYGPDIQQELAIRWEHIATTGLTKDLKKELIEKHYIPNNCTKIDAPKLNPEIKAALSDWLIKKDKAIESKQKQVAAGITCISEALTRMFSLEHRDQTVIKLLIEAGRLICDTQYNESMTRRSFICSSIKKDIKDQLYNTEIDSFLFGEKLADTLKAAKAISKSGAEIKIVPPKVTRRTTSVHRPKPPPARPLNQRPPLPATRQTGAARRYESSQMTAQRPRQPQQQQQPPRSQQQPRLRR